MRPCVVIASTAPPALAGRGGGAGPGGSGAADPMSAVTPTPWPRHRIATRDLGPRAWGQRLLGRVLCDPKDGCRDQGGRHDSAESMDNVSSGRGWFRPVKPVHRGSAL